MCRQFRNGKLYQKTDWIVATDFRYLRPRKAALLRHFYEDFSRNLHPLRCVAVDGATVVPPPPAVCNDGLWDCGVTDSDWRFVAESARTDKVPEIEAYARNASADTVAGTAMFCGFLNYHWGHFMVNSLARLWAAVSGRYDFDRLVFAVPKNGILPLEGNIREAFRLLNFDKPIDIIDAPRRYSRVLVPEEGCSSEEYVAPEILSVYDRIARASLAEHPYIVKSEKIYLSRGRFEKAVRSEFDVRWFDKFFAANGYRVVYPELISLGELISIIHGASSVAALAGTLPHTLLFGPDNIEVTVIEKFAYINSYQPGIDLVRKLNVTYVDANAFIWPVSPGGGPFIVYPNDLFRSFCADRMLRIEDLPVHDCRKMLRQFVKAYRRQYSRQWVYEEFLEPQIGLMREAYEASESDFGDWLTGKKPLFPSDLFSPRRLAKKLISFFR